MNCVARSTPTTTRRAASASAIADRTKSGRRICVTIDSESAADQSVTIRDRDSLAQVRVAMDQVRAWVQDRITA